MITRITAARRYWAFVESCVLGMTVRMPFVLVDSLLASNGHGIEALEQAAATRGMRGACPRDEAFGER